MYNHVHVHTTDSKIRMIKDIERDRGNTVWMWCEGYSVKKIKDNVYFEQFLLSCPDS